LIASHIPAKQMNQANKDRRSFLRYLASSPLVGVTSVSLAQQFAIPEITEPGHAVNVFDFEPIMQNNVLPPHYTYMAMGTDSGRTVQANREGFEQFRLRARRLIDVSNVDMRTSLFGEEMSMPVMIAPVGSQKSWHPDGEAAVARAARSRDCLQILSTMTTVPIEEVNRARGKPVWFQLYPTMDWNVTEGLVRRAERAGCEVLALTVDLSASNREAQARYRRSENPDCLACHATTFPEAMRTRPMFDDLDLSRLSLANAPQIDWNFVRRLRDLTDMRILIKGIVTQEDAAAAVAQGVDGIIVSNHGGRAEDSGMATILSLPEVVTAVGGTIPVIVDGGFRRGTDILKALALGADAVAIGRPYVWGLGAFGQAGVEAVLDILRRELQIVMMQVGATRLSGISSAAIRT
jgi:isopentenyl diphosphate isomerase/L-lactate dehydrogenase-like FMN-dependent dehydrogenase